MSHTITFLKTNGEKLLDEQTVTDFISMFYRGDDCRWRIEFVTTQEIREEGGVGRDLKFNGRILFQGVIAEVPNFRIQFNTTNLSRIIAEGKTCAGNKSHKTSDKRITAATVLAHELQHANQYGSHNQGDKFFNSRGYWNRACERDARLFVDEHINEIFTYFGAEPPPMNKRSGTNEAMEEELLNVVDIPSEVSDVTKEDIKDELRASKILNPKNFMRVVELLGAQ
jgi:hypothetical protein